MLALLKAPQILLLPLGILVIHTALRDLPGSPIPTSLLATLLKLYLHHLRKQ